MIRLQPAQGRRGLRAFHRIGRRVYRDLPLHRSTEDDVTRMLVEGPTAFHEHARVLPFLMLRGRRCVGRFALVHDERLPDVVQVAFYEALPGLDGVLDAIALKARASFPGVPRLVVGLNGHLNYGCGLLASRFDAPPLFGLPYTPPYYLDTFAALPARTMSSFRFPSEDFFALRRALLPTFDPGPVRVRWMDRAQFDREVDIYTDLNNACFQRHPYWADRTAAEDRELFAPFRALLRDEHVLIAEVDGRPVGFLLWYPDFNQLTSRDRELGARHVARYRLRDPIDTARLTEIAVRPDCRDRRIDLALILEMIAGVERAGYRTTEGGFIFDENRRSIALTLRYIQRATGRRPRPYRRFCVFDGPLREHDRGTVRVRLPGSPAPRPGTRIRTVRRAADLDGGWDGLADTLFQRREMLSLLEEHNPCRQRYVELHRDGRLAAGACVYTIRLDLLTYRGLPSPLSMRVVGVPCSQSAPGIIGDDDARSELLQHLLRTERGLVVGLNLERPLELDGPVWGRTLPAIVVDRAFASWEDYLSALRSPYRRRLRRLGRRWEGVVSEREPCDRFDDHMYAQYLAVFERSEARLERLPRSLFRALPPAFTLTTHRLDGALVGWHITARDGDGARFFMVGMDYDRQRELDAHGNIVAAVLRQAIEDGARWVDLGQTAEVSKTRIGGRPVPRHLFGYHRARPVRTLLARHRALLEYGGTFPEAHVFRRPDA